mgnify:CR=1 FL=1
MQIVFTRTVIATVLLAIHIQQAKKIHTLITCPPMFNSKDQPKGCKNEELAKKYASFTKYSETMLASTTKFTETENFYASLITAATKHFKDSKQKLN